MNLDATFSALADPTRRAILARLADGEASVAELAAPFAMSQPAISKHLKVLERAGLVSHGRDAQRRRRRLEAQPLAAANQWLESYRGFWERSSADPQSVLDTSRRKRGSAGASGESGLAEEVTPGPMGRDRASRRNAPGSECRSPPPTLGPTLPAARLRLRPRGGRGRP